MHNCTVEIRNTIDVRVFLFPRCCSVNNSKLFVDDRKVIGNSFLVPRNKCRLKISVQFQRGSGRHPWLLR